MRKRFLISLCSAALVSIFLIVSAGAAKALPFDDVSQNDWFYDAVVSVYDADYMNGVGETRFAPNEGLTRAMYVTIIGRIHNAPNIQTSFEDVESSTWYGGYVGWAKKAGIVEGYEDNTFRPNSLITREELITMTARYLNYSWTLLKESSAAVPSFRDEKDVSSWAVKSVELLRKTALVEGDQNGDFNPSSTATRAEVAAMTVRLVEAMKNAESDSSIGGNALSEYTVYSKYASDEDMTALCEVIKDKTGIEVPVSAEEGEYQIIIDEDESLQRLAYKMEQTGKKLIISVSTKYAVGYAKDIFEESLAGRARMTIPSEFAEIGTYELDSVSEHTDEQIVFLGESNKNPLSYAVSEKAIFRISMLANGKLVSAPTFSWRYETEDGGDISDVASAHSGQLILELPGCKVPGVGKLTVEAANKKGIPLASLNEINFVGGAVFGFNDINVAEKEPEDFDEFWSAQMQTILNIEPSAIEFGICKNCSNPNFDVYSGKIASIGDPAYIHVTVPKNAEPSSLKISVGFGAYGVYSMGPLYAPNSIYVTINPHSIENDMPSQYYDDLSSGKLAGFGFDDAPKEESYFLGMLQRDIQAIRFTEKQFENLWNGRDIEVSGGSMGGFQSIAVAGLYDKVTNLSAGIPWMCDIGGNANSNKRLNGWRPSYNEANAYFDSCYFAARIKCNTTISGGLGDYICPPSGVVSLYNALDCQKNISFKQNMGHGGGDAFNKSYYLAGSKPVIDSMEVEIIDNGSAIPAPDYSDNRELTQSEMQMKEAAASFRKEKLISLTYGASSEIIREDLGKLFYERLVEKHGLSPDCSVEIDVDSFLAFIKDYQSKQSGDSLSFSLDYTIRDAAGGYYDAQMRILAKKILPSED